MGTTAKTLFQGLSNTDARAHNDDIDIIRRAFEEYITYVTSDDVTLYPQLVGNIADEMEDIFVQYLYECGCKSTKNLGFREII